MAKSDSDFYQAQHKFAKDLYQGAMANYDEADELFMSAFGVKDTADEATPTGPDIARPARARAIEEKFRTLTFMRARTQLQVIPADTSMEELEACTKLEQALYGYQRAVRSETKRDPWRDFNFWYFHRGRSCLETRLDTTAISRGKMPIRTIVDDPKMIYSVWGRDGIGWYTKEYIRYAWDVKKEIDSRKSADKKNKWRKVELPDDDNSDVEVVEYWDDEKCAALVNGELLYEREHGYGFVPLAEAHCLDTPMADSKWAFQPVLGPIADSLKKIYTLISKLTVAFDLHYYPTILVVYDDGTIQTYDGKDFKASDIAQGVPVRSVQIVNPTSNAQLFQQLLGWLQGDVSLGGIPEVAWGMEPTTLTSGFAISQVLTQIMDKVWDKKLNLEAAIGWDFGHKLRLIEKFGAAKNVNLIVPMTPGYAEIEAGKGGKATLARLTPEMVGGRYFVEVTITPELPQDRLQKAQLAQAYRAPGVNGEPLLDDLSILENVIEADSPDLIRKRVRNMAIENKSKTIQEIVTLAEEQDWKDANPGMVKKAEQAKKEQDLPSLSPEQVQQLLAAMTGQPGAVPGQAPMPGQPGIPPEAMPSQFGMTPDQEIPDPTEVQLSQQARAGNPPA